jgi:ABC-type Fe3+-siderophore transport system permease subunit
MKKLIVLCFFLMMLSLTSCEVIGDIFSAGFYAGIFVVILVVVIIIWLLRKMGRRG